jgi:hypothetical protein
MELSLALEIHLVKIKINWKIPNVMIVVVVFPNDSNQSKFKFNIPRES